MTVLAASQPLGPAPPVPEAESEAAAACTRGRGAHTGVAVLLVWFDGGTKRALVAPTVPVAEA